MVTKRTLVHQQKTHKVRARNGDNCLYVVLKASVKPLPIPPQSLSRIYFNPIWTSVAMCRRFYPFYAVLHEGIRTRARDIAEELTSTGLW